jgi:hypothetical protein
MTKAAWLTKANQLLENYNDEITGRRGSTRLSTSEAKAYKAISDVVMSATHHVPDITFKQARDGMDQMVGWVNTGTKDSKFTTT